MRDEFYIPFRFDLSETKLTYEREVYSLMNLLSDFGGFNDGVIIIPAILMGMYNANQFYFAMAAIFPVKNKKRPKKKNEVQQKFATRDSLGTALDKEDI